jgi:hypothetical protein
MFRDEEYFPEQLTVHNRAFVGSLILSDHPGHEKPPTAACLMPVNGEIGYPEPHQVTSLKRQLNQAAQWPQTIDYSISRPTNAYVAATLESIPLLDVVRGFYGAAREEIPQLAGPTEADLNKLAGFEHVSIITHHAEATHNQTVEIARQLYNRGVGQVSALRGRAYVTAHTQEINATDLTSDHAEFMKKIGSMCIWY